MKATDSQNHHGPDNAYGYEAPSFEFNPKIIARTQEEESVLRKAVQICLAFVSKHGSAFEISISSPSKAMRRHLRKISVQNADQTMSKYDLSWIDKRKPHRILINSRFWERYKRASHDKSERDRIVLSMGLVMFHELCKAALRWKFTPASDSNADSHSGEYDDEYVDCLTFGNQMRFLFHAETPAECNENTEMLAVCFYHSSEKHVNIVAKRKITAIVSDPSAALRPYSVAWHLVPRANFAQPNVLISVRGETDEITPETDHDKRRPCGTHILSSQQHQYV